ncbi:MAG: hypothetical protein K6T90_20330 [Leptolyngbyaceae cyanobacterium HOT.MB2.61]|nr:hypothetical protein [Leptolyngbyaceae cyanobacterium HOT.MB2.61]
MGKFFGVAEWCHEAIAARLENSLRSLQNHSLIQQPQFFHNPNQDRYMRLSPSE